MTCYRAIGLSLSLTLASWAAQSSDGLLAPASEALWPNLQARIALQTNSVSALGLVGLGGLGGARQPAGVQGGAVFGDYYFARPSFGGFRATSGLLVGTQSGMPQLSTGQGTRLGLTLNNSAQTTSSTGDGLAAVPYLGIGFSSQAASGGWSLSADLGLVADSASPASLRRALGVQGVENTRRELRLSPLLQVGWRYSF